jgi:hypothetical protein
MSVERGTPEVMKARFLRVLALLLAPFNALGGFAECLLLGAVGAVLTNILDVPAWAAAFLGLAVAYVFGALRLLLFGGRR